VLIAFFADIHSNRQAFSSCLVQARDHGAERIVLLGDYVGYGADPEWTVKTVMDLVDKGAMAVLGNHDSAISNPREQLNVEAKVVIEWTRGELGASQRQFLAGLPLTLNDSGRLYVHAEASNPKSWTYVASAAEAVVDLAVEVHQQRVDREIAAAQVLFERRGEHVRLSRIRRVGLRSSRHELHEMLRHRDLGRAVSLEGDRRSCTGQLCEALSKLKRAASLHHHIEVRLRSADQAVADVAADHPSLGALVGSGSFQETQQLAVVYWLIRAHSTAPTCPARSPRRARRRRGRRAGLMNGEERSVATIIGCTSPHERVTPPPITNISGSKALVRLISAIPM